MRRGRNFAVPIVSERAAASYLRRRLDNHDWLKEAPVEELKAHAYSLGHRFAVDPWVHQLACFALGAAYKQFCFFLKMGGGKTSVFLNQVRYRKRRREMRRALALVPYLLHVHSWKDQIEEHAPDLTYRLLVGDRGEREALLKDDCDICVMNYAGLQVYMAERVRKKGKRKDELVVDKSRAAQFASLWQMLGFDESHRLGNHQSLIHKLCWWLSCGAEFRYAFSGTAFGRDPTRLQPQFMLVDHGKTLGSTLGVFRNAFFEPHKSYWSGVEWTFREEMAPELNRIIKHRSITYELEEMRDMPRKVTVRLPVRLRGEAATHYERIIDGIRESRGDYRTLDNVYTRMRQCASGFIAMRADDESRIEVRFKENPKLDGLREFVLTKAEDEKLLVYHEFVPSGMLIEEMLKACKIGHAVLRGGMKNPEQSYDRFLNDSKCRVFVLNNKLGSECINPQYVARRVIFYESPDDPIQRSQAEGRVRRPGQKEIQFVNDMVVLGTIEERILQYLHEGESLFKAVMSGDISALFPDEEEVAA